MTTPRKLTVSEILIHGVQPTDSPSEIAAAARELGFSPGQVGIELDVLAITNPPSCISKDEQTREPLAEILAKYFAAEFGGLFFLDFKRGNISEVLALAKSCRKRADGATPHSVAVWPGMEALLRYLPSHDKSIQAPENWIPRLLVLWSGGTWANDTEILTQYLASKVLVWEPLGGMLDDLTVQGFFPKFERVVYKLPFDDPTFLNDPKSVVVHNMEMFIQKGGEAPLVPFGSLSQIQKFLEATKTLRD